MRISTIGGNVAENSGGLRGLKYGVTRDYVMGLEVVLADSEAVVFGNKCVKDVAGYSMKDIFIGSEGTLGIITKVLLQLVPKPAAKKTLLATFSKMDAAAETVSAIIAAKIIPCTLEFLDKITIRCIEEYAHVGLPLDAEAVLLMETDGHPAVVQEEAQQMAEIARRHGAAAVQVAQTSEEATRLSTARRVAFSVLGTCVAYHDPGRRNRAQERAGQHDPLHPAGRREVRSCGGHFRSHGRREPSPDVSNR